MEQNAGASFVGRHSLPTVTSTLGGYVSDGRENANPPALADVANIRVAATANAKCFTVLSSKVNFISQ